jgi:hypothetical protein
MTSRISTRPGANNSFGPMRNVLSMLPPPLQ